VEQWTESDKAVDRQSLQTVHKRNAKRFEVGRCNSTDVANDSYACCTAKIGVIGGGTWNWLGRGGFLERLPRVLMLRMHSERA